MLRHTAGNRSYSIDMTTGPTARKLLSFAIPLMISGILQLLFNTADVIVVGKFAGDNALAAVGSNTSMISLITNLFIGVSVGANVCAARCYGAHDHDGFRETLHTSITMSLLFGIVVSSITIPFAHRILIAMSAPPEVLPLASRYLAIYLAGLSGVLVYNFGSAILRSVGDTRRALYYLLFSGILNVILNLIFVIILKMNVAGVALATIISQYTSAFLVVRCLIREKGDLHLDLRNLRITPRRAKIILRIGIPAGIQSVLFNLSNVIIQASINSFGAIAVAGNSAASNLEGFIYQTMNSVYQAVLSFTGQNVGARKENRSWEILWKGLIIVSVISFCMGCIWNLAGSSLLSLYTDNPDVIAAGKIRLSYVAKLYFLCGMMDVTVGALRGLGYSILPMFVSLMGACALRIILVFTVFRIPEYHSIHTLYILYPITWTVTLIIQLICYRFALKKVLIKRNNHHDYD